MFLAGTDPSSVAYPFLGGACAAALLWLAPPAAAQNQLWERRLTTDGLTEAEATAPAGTSGVYVLGRTEGSLGAPSAGGFDVFLARYDGGGSQAWIRQFGSSTWDTGTGAAPDGAGGVFLCGGTLGSLAAPSAGGDDTWLARYDGSGNRAWIRQLGTSAIDFASGAAPDGAGGVYWCGTSNGSFGGPRAGGTDAWLARHDGAGNPLWILQLGTSAGDHASTVAPDGTGGVYVGGWTSGSLGGPARGRGDAWLARYDGAGNQLWILQTGANGSDVIRASAPDGTGGVYVSGYTEGCLDGPIPGPNRLDAWVARFDGAGSQIWLERFGTDSSEDSYAAASDGVGGVYVAEHGLTASSEYRDPTLTRFDGTGSRLWALAPDIPRAFSIFGATPDGSGGVYVAGSTRGRTEGWIARYEALCGPPSFTPRNSGANPPSLQVAAPVLGSSFTATVDLTTTGHAVAYLFAYDSPTDVTLRGGQHLLCTDSGGGLLYGRTVSGPLATFQIPVRNDANLCGLRFSMQAVHYGGVVPFALSNAQDLVIGF